LAKDATNRETVAELFTLQSQTSDSLNDSSQEILQSLTRDRNLTEELLLGQSDTLIKLHAMLEKSVKATVEDAKLEIMAAVRMLNWTKTISNWDHIDAPNTPFYRVTDKIREDSEIKDAFKQIVYDRLQFPAMNERLEDIPEAHKSTFHWAYTASSNNGTSWDSFSEWLIRGRGIYWIQGKPGSGVNSMFS
jgi:hypothetical protein